MCPPVLHTQLGVCVQYYALVYKITIYNDQTKKQRKPLYGVNISNLVSMKKYCVDICVYINLYVYTSNIETVLINNAKYAAPPVLVHAMQLKCPYYSTLTPVAMNLCVPNNKKHMFNLKNVVCLRFKIILNANVYICDSTNIILRGRTSGKLFCSRASKMSHANCVEYT